jgi:hypothetical protein
VYVYSSARSRLLNAAALACAHAARSSECTSAAYILPVICKLMRYTLAHGQSGVYGEIMSNGAYALLRKRILSHLRNWMPTPPFDGSNTTGARVSVTFLALGPSARICRMKGVTGSSCCAIILLTRTGTYC